MKPYRLSLPSLGFFKGMLLLIFCFGGILNLNAQFYDQNDWEEAFDGRTSNLNPISDSLAVFTINNYNGLININKDTLIPAVYQNIRVNGDFNYIIAQKNRRYGAIDLNNNVLIPFEYYSLYEKAGYFLGRKKKEYILIDSNYNLTNVDLKAYNDVILYKGFVLIKGENQLMGAISYKGQKLLDPEYDYIIQNNDQGFILRKKDTYSLWSPTEGILKTIESKIGIAQLTEQSYLTSEKNKYTLVNNGRTSKEFQEIQEKALMNAIICSTIDTAFLYDLNLRLLTFGKSIKIIYRNVPNQINIRKRIDPHFVINTFDDDLVLFDGEKNVIKGAYRYFKHHGAYILAVGETVVKIYDSNYEEVMSLAGIDFRFDSDFLIYKEDENTSIALDTRLKPLRFRTKGRLYYQGFLFYTYSYIPKVNYKLYDRQGKLLNSDNDDRSYSNASFNSGIKVSTLNNDGLKGWLTEGQIIEPRFQEVHFTPNEKVLVKQNRKWGVYNIFGEEVLPITHDSLYRINNSNVYALKNAATWKIYGNNTVIDAKKVRFDNNNTIQYQNVRDEWKAIDKLGTIYPIPIESTFQDYIQCELENCKLYISYDQFKTHIQFDTIYEVGYEYVGQNGDSLYYLDAYKNIDFTILGDRPLGSLGGMKMVEINDSIGIYQKPNGQKYGRLFKRIYKTRTPQHFFYIKEDNNLVFYDKNGPSNRLPGDSVYVSMYPYCKLFTKNKSKWYNLETNKEIDLPVESFINQTDFNYIAKDTLLYKILLDKDMNVLSKPYDEIRPMNQFFAVKSGRVRALLDKEGKELIPSDEYYSSFSWIGQNLIKAEKNGFYGVYNIEDNEWYPPEKYQDIKSCNIRIPLIGDLFIFRQNGLYGVMNENCDVILNNEYTEIQSLGIYLTLKMQNGKSKLYYPKDQVFIPMEYDKLQSYWYNQRKVLLKTEDKYYIFSNEKLIKESDYNYVERLHNSNIFKYRDESGKMGILDSMLNVKINPTFDYIDDYYGRHLRVQKGGKRGMMNFEGEIVVPLEFDEMDSKGNLLLFKKDNKFAYYNKKKEEFVNEYFDDIQQVHEFYLFRNGNGHTMYDSYFNKLLTAEGERIKPLGNDAITIKNNGTWQIFDYNNKLLNDSQFRYVSRSTNTTVFAIMPGQKEVVFFDYQKDKIIPTSHQEYGITLDMDAQGWQSLKDKNIEPYSNYIYSHCVIRDNNNGLMGLANPLGDLLIQPDYQEIQVLHEKEIIGVYKQDDKYGIILKDYSMTANIYDQLQFEGNKPPVFRATLNGQQFLVDMNGNRK